MSILKKQVRIFCAMLFGFVLVSAAIAAPITEGKQYQRVSRDILENKTVKALKAEHPQKIDVLEFFSYGCSACYRLDPIVEKWRKTLTKEVNFQRVPVEFQPAWGILTKVYFTSAALGVLDKLHSPFFEAIQMEELKTLDRNILADFFAKKGVSREKFLNTYDSFDIDHKHKWSQKMTKAYQISRVPTLVIQGNTNIYTTSMSMAGGNEKVLLEVLNHLIDQEKALLTKQPITTK